MITRHASAKWHGGLKDGKGSLDTQSGVFTEQPYGFNTRFGDDTGTNPEELIAAAHAGCFTMALSKVLGDRGMTADTLETKATVTLEQVGEGFEVTKSHLVLTATIAGADEQAFMEAASAAKDNCPISKLLTAEITLEATLNN